MENNHVLYAFRIIGELRVNIYDFGIISENFIYSFANFLRS